MEFDINNLLRLNIKKLKPYSSARDEFEGSASVFLDANENPYSSSYNRYPDPYQKKLKSKIAAIKKVKEEQLFLGNGSDEAIDLLIRAFCAPGVDEIITMQPSYGMYEVSASINDTHVKHIPLTETFDIDISATLNSITSNTKLIFLCSPNNPTGNLLSHDKIIELIRNFTGLVIIDEAYIDFANVEGFVFKLNQYKNLVVLQTLSKAWGLAGLRLGMCFASPEIIAVLNKIKPPYNISSTTQSIVGDLLSNSIQKEKQVNEIIAQREILNKKLPLQKVVEHVYPSDANFILVQVKEAKLVYSKLLQKGIVVRDRSNVSLCGNCLRITVGTPIENEILLNELESL